MESDNSFKGKLVGVVEDPFYTEIRQIAEKNDVDWVILASEEDRFVLEELADVSFKHPDGRFYFIHAVKILALDGDQYQR